MSLHIQNTPRDHAVKRERDRMIQALRFFEAVHNFMPTQHASPENTEKIEMFQKVRAALHAPYTPMSIIYHAFIPDDAGGAEEYNQVLNHVLNTCSEETLTSECIRKPASFERTVLKRLTNTHPSPGVGRGAYVVDSERSGDAMELDDPRVKDILNVFEDQSGNSRKLSHFVRAGHVVASALELEPVEDPDAYITVSCAAQGPTHNGQFSVNSSCQQFRVAFEGKRTYTFKTVTTRRLVKHITATPGNMIDLMSVKRSMDWGHIWFMLAHKEKHLVFATHDQLAAVYAAFKGRDVALYTQGARGAVGVIMKSKEEYLSAPSVCHFLCASPGGTTRTEARQQYIQGPLVKPYLQRDEQDDQDASDGEGMYAPY